MKKVIIFFVLLLLASACIFANGGNEGRFYYLPMNVANNTNVMIELSQPKSVTNDMIANLSEQDNMEDTHMVAFRLRDNIMKNEGNTSFNNFDSFNLTLTSTSSWEFVHEENPTKRIPFEISIYCKEKEYSNSNYTAFSTSENLFTNSTLPYSHVPSSATKAGSTITLSLPTTGVSDNKPVFIRDYYFCITIPEHAVTESGYYSTTINLSSDKYYEVGLEETAFLFWTIYSLKKEEPQKTIQDTINSITIRGYIGKEPGTDSGSYSFMVSNTSHTYSMDLGITDPNTSYDVARIYFYNTKLRSGVNESTVKSTENFTAYKIYISPERNTSSSEDYKFRLIGSESDSESDENTIYYDLYIDPKGSGLVSLSNCSNYTTNNSYDTYRNNVSSNYSTSKLGGVKKTNSVYVLYPQYSYSKISSGNDYQQLWQTDTTLVIKLQKRSTDKAETHLNGMYKSTLYFTVESP